MKKIMIALAAVAMAIGAQAAQVNWTTSKIYGANDDGSFTSTLLKSTTGATAFSVTVAFFDSDGDAMTVASGTSSSSFTKAGAATNTTSSEFVVGDDYYYQASYTYTDANGNVRTMSTGKTAFTFTTETGNHPLSVATGSSWSAVPEPTSGLLLLIGMAGLALRRRRA